MTNVARLATSVSIGFALATSVATARADQPVAPRLVPYVSASSSVAPPPPLHYSEAELPPEDDGPYAPRTGSRTRVGLKGAGMVVTLAGLGAAALGGLIFGIASSGNPRGDDLGYGRATQSVGTTLGGAMLLAGGAATLVGIPLWAVGSATSSSQP